jgi:peptide/nickel transport system substrate-binding protein
MMRPNPKKSIFFSALFFFLTLVLAAPAMAAEEPQQGGVYRVPSTDPRSLDPHIETYEQTTAVTNNTYNRLIRWNEDMSGFELDLAESWRRIDPLTFEFKLHQGVRFQDLPPVGGRELTSADVKYSLERVGGAYGRRAEFKHKYYYDGKLASIETPDKYTVVIKTKEPYAPSSTISPRTGP